MKQARLPLWGLVLTALTFLAIGVIDTRLSRMTDPSSWRGIVGPPMDVLELLFGFPLSKWATGLAILAAAIVLGFFVRWRPVARLLLFVSVSQLITRLIAGFRPATPRISGDSSSRSLSPFRRRESRFSSWRCSFLSHGSG